MDRLLILFLMFTIGEAYNDYYHDSGPFEGFVVGGVSVPILMYPHIAQLKLHTIICGGSIISDRVILTAAHCLFTPNNTLVSPVNVTAYLGYAYHACKVVPHEKYNAAAKETYYYYDLGLILLKEFIQFGPRVKRIEIADTEEFRDERYTFTLAGFGAVTSLFPTGPNKSLKATRMFYVNSQACDQTQSFGKMDVPDHMFCMIGEGWTSDCFGDSGSGIIWKRLLVGIVSTGRDVFCGSDLLPSMYTDIVYFRKWIKENVDELEANTVNRCKRSKRNKNRSKPKSKLRKFLKNGGRLSYYKNYESVEMHLEIE